MKALLFLMCLLLASLLNYAQIKYSISNRNAIKNYETASAQIDLNNFKEAIFSLNAAIKEESKFIEAYLLLADIHRSLADYLLAKEAYKKAFIISPTFAPERLFYYAESELNTGEYEAALLHFKTYKNSGKAQFDKILLTDKYINDCIFALEGIKKPVDFKPNNLGQSVNTQHEEYFAALTSDEATLIFTRQIKGKEDFYRSLKINNQWALSTPLSQNINTPEFNEGAQCLSPDGQFLFFTGCTRPDGFGRCDIYVSKKEGNDWSKPVNLGFPINTSGWESQPSLSADGKTLYFVSDRKGGFGSYDIWKSTILDDGKWTMPENMGPNINTLYSEQYPFIHPDGKTFYFSSTGWTGFGRKDLFISRLDTNNVWSKPNNLGFPINTYGDESGLTINTSGTKAFFSSNNFNGFGGFDIYSFDLPQNIRPAAVNYVKGVVYDDYDNKRLGALIDIIDLKTGNSIYTSYSDAIDGTFLGTLPKGNEYSLNASKEGYLFYSENFSLEKYLIGKPIELEVPLQKIAVGKKVVLKNIFFDSNKYDLKPTSKAELQKLIDFLQENITVFIEIDGHTDDVGNDQSNLTLSQNRSKAVFQYLLEHNIKADRIKYKGYGETMPVADNKTSLGRANNRRTEFVITGIGN
jgi:outer membrane protein OmpA-like peptidoglycan-associated protein/Tol biopolymer transport system component